MAVFERLKVGLDSFFNWLGQSSLRAACFAQLWPAFFFALALLLENLLPTISTGESSSGARRFYGLIATAGICMMALFTTYFMTLVVPPRERFEVWSKWDIRSLALLTTASWVFWTIACVTVFVL